MLCVGDSRRPYGNCIFDDFWRHYQIAFDSKTQLVNFKTYMFSRPSPIEKRFVDDLPIRSRFVPSTAKKHRIVPTSVRRNVSNSDTASKLVLCFQQGRCQLL
jgi:hypothetical protein